MSRGSLKRGWWSVCGGAWRSHIPYLLNDVSGCLYVLAILATSRRRSIYFISGCLLLRQIHQALRHAVDAARAHGEHNIAVLQHVVQQGFGNGVYIGAIDGF